MAGSNTASTSTPPKKHKPKSTTPSKKSTGDATNKKAVYGSTTSFSTNRPTNVKKNSAPVSSRALVVVDNKNNVNKKAPKGGTTPKPKSSPTKPKPAKQHDNEEDNDEDPRQRLFVCGAVLCCLITLLILGLVLGLVVFQKDDDTNNKNNQGNSAGSNAGSDSANGGGSPNESPIIPNFPTQAPIPLPPSARVPTRAPASPTPAPVTGPPVPTTPAPIPAPVNRPTSLLQPNPSQLVIIPFADTYVQRDGFRPFEAYGSEDTFLVQNGPTIVNEIPDVVGLLGFDISQIPSSFSQVLLQLYHQPASRDRGAATLTIRLMPPTPLAIETLHAGLFDPNDNQGTFGPTFAVSPDDTVVQVDITALLNNQNEDQLFLMIENRGPEQPRGAEGDRFYTRETTDPPQLVVSF